MHTLTMTGEPDKMAAMENTIHHSTQFDYDAIDGEDGNDYLTREGPTAVELAAVGLALREVMDWVTGEGRGRDKGARVRFVAFLWCMAPDYYGHATQTAMAARLGVATATFCAHVSSFRDQFRWTCARLRSEENRARSARSAKARHRAKGRG